MRTNKEKLKALIQEHLDNMKNDITSRMNKVIGNDHWYKAKSIVLYDSLIQNIYFESIDWLAEYDTQYPLAWIRTDIISSGHGVQVGTDYYGGIKPLPFRYLHGIAFQVLYAGTWVPAKRNDWDFTDAVPEVETTKDDKRFLDMCPPESEVE